MTSDSSGKCTLHTALQVRIGTVALSAQIHVCTQRGWVQIKIVQSLNIESKRSAQMVPADSNESLDRSSSKEAMSSFSTFRARDTMRFNADDCSSSVTDVCPM